MTMTQTMTIEEWEEKYQPVINHIDSSASWQNEYGVGILFETYDEELEFVKSKIDENKVWTYLDGDDGGTFLVAGYSVVNRIGYLVTDIPWESLDICIDVSPADEEEEEPNAIYIKLDIPEGTGIEGFMQGLSESALHDLKMSELITNYEWSTKPIDVEA